ncbi:phosphodiesterase [Roseovarius faecimaris]|uniref:Phosphodiesterase n=1 Tax=Roseovarius faecimaris TaxID=2494550 RepID=A0A6I6IR73_9RHOB|nr:metallophosphoesterase [Roseovarius faecimaris]QGX99225.1 phosphodiesterase [Roseovarius faecimaris]
MARLLQLSDLHVVAPGQLCSGVLDTCALLRAAIDRLIAMRPALGALDGVLITGDVSDDGSPESYAFARAELDRLGLALLPLPGNHDNRAAFRAGFGDLEIMPEQGLIDWAADVADCRVIGLDTLVEGQGGGRLRAESLDFLAAELDMAGGRPVIVALHHPPLRTRIRFMDAIGLDNVPALEKVLERAPQDVTVLAGHVHRVHLGRVGRHSVMTAPSVCSAFALDLRAKAPVGFLKGPTGCAVIETGPGGTWSVLPLDQAEGPYPF